MPTKRTQVCTKCGKRKNVWDFVFRSKKAGTRRKDCKVCQRKVTGGHYRKHKEDYLSRNRDRRIKNKELLAEFKDRPCVDCGGEFHHCQMQFDHKEGQEKVGNISALVHRHHIKQAYEEIEKCDLVCANCHALRTWKRIKGIDLIDAA